MKRNMKKGLLASALLLAIGAVGASADGWSRTSELETRCNKKSEAFFKAVRAHESFVSSMPKYDAFTHWLEGENYTAFLSKDINQRYR